MHVSPPSLRRSAEEFEAGVEILRRPSHFQCTVVGRCGHELSFIAVQLAAPSILSVCLYALALALGLWMKVLGSPWDESLLRDVAQQLFFYNAACFASVILQADSASSICCVLFSYFVF